VQKERWSRGGRPRGGAGSRAAQSQKVQRAGGPQCARAGKRVGAGAGRARARAARGPNGWLRHRATARIFAVAPGRPLRPGRAGTRHSNHGLLVGIACSCQLGVGGGPPSRPPAPPEPRASLTPTAGGLRRRVWAPHASWRPAGCCGRPDTRMAARRAPGGGPPAPGRAHGRDGRSCCCRDAGRWRAASTRRRTSPRWRQQPDRGRVRRRRWHAAARGTALAGQPAGHEGPSKWPPRSATRCVRLSQARRSA
jgi:hypothetical protein